MQRRAAQSDYFVNKEDLARNVGRSDNVTLVKRIEITTLPLWSLAYVIGCWLMLLYPKEVSEATPRIPWLLPGHMVKPTARHISQVLPFLNLHKAWLLGHLSLRLQQQLITADDAVAESATILNAGGLTRGPQYSLSPQEILSLGAVLQDYCQPSGMLHKLAGFLSFVTVMWCIGALGVAVALAPTLSITFKWLLNLSHLVVQLLNWLRPAVQYLLEMLQLLVPKLAAPALQALALYITCASARYPADTTAPLIALTGVCIHLATHIVSLHRMHKHLVQPFDADSQVQGQQRRQQQQWRRWQYQNPSSPGMQLLFVYLHKGRYLQGVLTLCPLASQMSSKLLGFLAVACLFSALGFVVVPFIGGYLIGWHSHQTMISTTVSSALVMGLVLLPQMCTPSACSAAVEQLLAPYRTGLSCFGAITLCLAGLIWSSRLFWYGTEYSGYLWAVCNVVYVLVLLHMMMLGGLFGASALFNTAMTFLVLWAAQKSLELVIDVNMWPAILAASIGLCWAASFVHSNPAFILSMLHG